MNNICIFTLFNATFTQLIYYQAIFVSEKLRQRQFFNFNMKKTFLVVITGNVFKNKKATIKVVNYGHTLF